jgi:surface protein
VATPSAVVYFEYTTMATPSAVVYFEYTTTTRSQVSQFFGLFCVFETVPFWLFVVGWSCFFSVAPSLAVFHTARAFNQDVYKWNTGAVTDMSESKCTLSPNSSFIGS